MCWPPNSSDLNPIENFWAILKRLVYSEEKPFSSLDAFWNAVISAVRSIDPQQVKSLTDSVD